MEHTTPGCPVDASPSQIRVGVSCVVAYMAGQHSVDVNLIVQVDVSVRVCLEDWFFMFESW